MSGGFKEAKDERVTGFKEAKDERIAGFKEARNERHAIQLQMVEIKTLLNLYLLKDGFSFQAQEEAVKKAQDEFLEKQKQPENP
jgi:hypothetical protein